MDISQKIDNIINLNADKFKQMFFEILRCPTINPPGNEEKMAQIIYSWLEDCGGKCQLQYVEKDRPNLLCDLHFGKGGRRLLFNSHMDVVPAGESANWQSDPFEPEERDGLIYARGASDDKGGLMSMIIACILLQELPIELNGTLSLCGAMGEETGGMGTKYWVEQGCRADAAIIGEPSKLELVIAHRGAYRPIIAFKGRTAHSSEPDFGKNAIYDAARFALKVEEMNNKFKGTKNIYTGSPTIAATVFQGGVKNNVIPDYAEVSIDRRLSPGETFIDGEKEILALLQQMQANKEIGEFELARCLNNKSAALVDPDEEIVHIAQETLSECGLKDDLLGMRATTDMSILTDVGIPTIILGPGDMALAHCPNEYIDFKEILVAAKLYAMIAIKFLK